MKHTSTKITKYERRKQQKRKALIALIIVVALLVVLISIPLILNGIVVGTTKDRIREITPEDGYEYALVLGAKVHKGGRLSDMLRDRMDVGIALYHEGAVNKLLLSGDGSGEWSETEYMKRYAMEKGVPEEAILTDGEGYSTYESLDRAKALFHADRLVIVTQKYHLYRALYIAEDLEITAHGADAALYSYAGQLYREIREILARGKDLVKCVFNG